MAAEDARSGESNISVVILNWNSTPDTLACVSSLRDAMAFSGVTWPIVVVDNGSENQESFVDEIGRIAGVCVIANSENLGFAAGCNSGINHVTRSHASAEFVMLLNNDAQVARGFVQEILRAIESGDYDLLAPLILESRDPDVISYAGGTIDRWRCRANVPDHGSQVENYELVTVRETEFITLACALLRLEALPNLRIPDDYFFGTEEVDLSWRQWKAGKRMVVAPRAIVVHPGAGTHRDAKPEYIYNGYRNRMIFSRRNHPAALGLLWRLLYALYIVSFLPIRRARLHKGSLSDGRLVQAGVLAARYALTAPKVTREEINAAARCLA